MSLSAPDILLIEDSPTTAELFRFALKSNKSASTVQILNDGLEAIELLLGDSPTASGSRTLPRLVLLDLHMPRLDGFEVLKRLRADERTRGLSIVVYSSSDEEADQREAHRLGADGYIRKPAGYENFCKAVAEIESAWLRSDARGTVDGDRSE